MESLKIERNVCCQLDLNDVLVAFIRTRRTAIAHVLDISGTSYHAFALKVTKRKFEVLTGRTHRDRDRTRDRPTLRNLQLHGFLDDDQVLNGIGNTIRFAIKGYPDA